MGLIQMRNTQMKKIVLILSASFSSISAFANEDFASNEIANDEIVAQTFADGATGEIAALSNEEMQNTKGAMSTLAVVSTGLGVANGVLHYYYSYPSKHNGQKPAVAHSIAHGIKTTATVYGGGSMARVGAEAAGTIWGATANAVWGDAIDHVATPEDFKR